MRIHRNFSLTKNIEKVIDRHVEFNETIKIYWNTFDITNKKKSFLFKFYNRNKSRKSLFIDAESITRFTRLRNAVIQLIGRHVYFNKANDPVQ